MQPPWKARGTGSCTSGAVALELGPVRPSCLSHAYAPPSVNSGRLFPLPSFSLGALPLAPLPGCGMNHVSPARYHVFPPVVPTHRAGPPTGPAVPLTHPSASRIALRGVPQACSCILPSSLRLSHLTRPVPPALPSVDGRHVRAQAVSHGQRRRHDHPSEAWWRATGHPGPARPLVSCPVHPTHLMRAPHHSPWSIGYHRVYRDLCGSHQACLSASQVQHCFPACSSASSSIHE